MCGTKHCRAPAQKKAKVYSDTKRQKRGKGFGKNANVKICREGKGDSKGRELPELKRKRYREFHF